MRFLCHYAKKNMFRSPNLPGSKTISAPILLRGGNSESMWNMVMGTHLVVKFQSSFDNFQVHLDYFYESYSL